MIIPTQEIRAVREFLFKHGCIVVEDNKTLENHKHVGVSNLKVMKILRSMLSKELVDKVFVWRHAYYTLTDEGISWLRNKLYLGEDVYPLTHSAIPMASEHAILADGAPKFRRS